jgi:hypothetical protein
MKLANLVPSAVEFDWDEWNLHKNWDKHHVSPIEAEDIFFNEPIIVEHASHYSGTENRFYAFGRTDKQRLLFIVFTVRRSKIRVISEQEGKKKI